MTSSPPSSPARSIADPLLDEAHVRLSVTDARADVLLDNPDVRNAQTARTWFALARVPELLPPDVRVVVLSASGASFSAGLDRRLFTGEPLPGTPSLHDLARLSSADLDETIAGYQQAFTWWRAHDAVSIAAVHGHAVGAGFQLALATDLMVVADDAQLSMRETSLGLVPDLGGTGLLVSAVGYGRALEICATGRWVRADEAATSGIAQLAVPRDALDATVDDLAAAILASPAGAVSATKRLLRSAMTASPSDQLAAERAEQTGRLADLAALLG